MKCFAKRQTQKQITWAPMHRLTSVGLYFSCVLKVKYVFLSGSGSNQQLLWSDKEEKKGECVRKPDDSWPHHLKIFESRSFWAKRSAWREERPKNGVGTVPGLFNGGLHFTFSTHPPPSTPLTSPLQWADLLTVLMSSARQTRDAAWPIEQCGEGRRAAPLQRTHRHTQTHTHK